MLDLYIFGLWVLLWPLILAQKTFDLKVDFGAKGNNVVADTLAFQTASKEINLAKSATLNIPKDTYLVSGQRERPNKNTSLPYWLYDGVFNAKGLTRLTVNGNDATIKLADGLRYGAFDEKTGLKYPTNVSGFATNRIAHVGAIFQVWDSTNVAINKLHINGNVQKLVIGNEVGDTGIQAGGAGFVFDNCPGGSIKDSTARYCGLDGFTIRDSGAKQKTYSPVVLSNVVAEGNGRQGLSWIGGFGLTVTNSRFSLTGRTLNAGKPHFSAPGAGIDIEPNPGHQFTRGGRFTNVTMSDNIGSALSAPFSPLKPTESPNNDDSTFDRCTFDATTSYAAWIRQPGMTFRDSTFIGTVEGGSDGTRADGTRDPKRAAKFIGCSFRRNAAFAGVGDYLHHVIDSSGVSWTNCNFQSKGRSMFITLTSRYSNPPKHTISGCTFTHDKLATVTRADIATFKGVVFSGKTVFKETAAMSAAAGITYNMVRDSTTVLGDTKIVDSTGTKRSQRVFWWPRV